MKKELTVKGTNGTIVADNEKVTISRKGAGAFITQGIKGDRTIYYQDLKAVEYRNPTMLANGYLQLITNAELATNQKVSLLGSSTKAMRDENTVILRAFKKQTVTDAQNVYDFIQENIHNLKTSQTTPNSVSDADEIAKFKTLLDSGAITEEEFEAKKKQLLKL
ncbi:SHOCT domain-containing protein [Furfurilactobacillus entadae]|uniref:SHOCT domain-containing protein n=1 Tax=Furfurilactobacillus entadae TaxID=2922307 RepID=UPI0035EC5C71